MRVWIGISAPAGGKSYDVDIRLDSEAGDQLATRSMRRLDEAPWVAPAEPAETGELADLAEVQRAARHVTEGWPHPAVVTTVGRHLFESLLGTAAWEAIEEAASSRGVRVLELALSWPLEERALHRPPWEAMHDGEYFLGAHPRLTVAVTRIVRARAGADPTPPPTVPAPARVLFVIGAGAGDPQIRVGKEVLGLIRSAEKGVAGIDPLILDEARIETLEVACARFKPHIVHFVTHGRLSAEREGQLQLQGERPDEVDWVGAGQIMNALEAAGEELPTVAVLTGCKSAASGRHVDPLAAELVRRGIPAALGMVGRISDPVCRLFARKFGAALSAGEPLVKALTDGRRAGLHKQQAAAGNDPAWALPSIYLADNVSADYSLVDVDSPSPVVARVKKYKLQLEPVFCGRVELTSEFDRLLVKSDDLNALVAYTEQPDEPLGKTRLLHEFAARALRRGHLVVMIDDRGNDISRLPRYYAQLAIDMLQRIIDVRRHFGLDAPQSSSLVKVLEWASQQRFHLDLSGADTFSLRRGRYGAFIEQCWRNHGEIDGESVSGSLKEALAEDLTQLARDAREAHPENFDADKRVVAILGAIGDWGEVTELLCESLIDTYGLGTEQDPVPVFATCAMANAPVVLGRARNEASGSTSISYQRLDRLKGEEEVLAYQAVLLHPLQEKVGLRDPLPAYVPNPNYEGEYQWESELKKALEGVPGNFGYPGLNLRLTAPLLAAMQLLVEADDEDVIANYLESPAP
jgi:hypothetical protein